MGTVIGKNSGTFGRLDKETIEIPKGEGKVILKDTKANTGAIVG